LFAIHGWFIGALLRINYLVGIAAVILERHKRQILDQKT
jgi:hypothetical protein